MNFKKNLVIIMLTFLPMITFAAGSASITFKGFVSNLMNQINILPQIIFALAFMFFLYNIMSYIQANDPKQIQEASKMITYSIIGLFVMVSVWGLVNVIINSTGIGTDAPIVIPS